VADFATRLRRGPSIFTAADFMALTLAVLLT
jgi:hypothetical protein